MTFGLTLGGRMKDYERETRLTLPPKSYSVIRVDGRAFHTWTKGMPRPYSQALMNSMSEATLRLCEEVSGAVLGYTQSDEISVVFQDFVGKHTEPWFGGVVQKIASVAASIVTASFAQQFDTVLRPAHFDARVFSLPGHEEVANYLIWRQRDCEKNAITMLAAEHFTHKQLNGVNTQGRIDKLRSVGVDASAADPRFLRGQMAFRHTENERVRYFDPRTQTEYITPEPVKRHRWVSEAAPRGFSGVFAHLPIQED